MGRTDRAGLLLHVDPRTVFAALTTPDDLLAWLPPAGMTGRFERFEMREGGSYRLVLTYADAADSPGKTSAGEDASEVRITRLIPGELLVQEVEFESDDPDFHGVMRMEWVLRPTEDGTDLDLWAHDVPPGVRARDHAAGLTSSLANLAAHLEP